MYFEEGKEWNCLWHLNFLTNTVSAMKVVFCQVLEYQIYTLYCAELFYLACLLLTIMHVLAGIYIIMIMQIQYLIIKLRLLKNFQSYIFFLKYMYKIYKGDIYNANFFFIFTIYRNLEKDESTRSTPADWGSWSGVSHRATRRVQRSEEKGWILKIRPMCCSVCAV